MPERPIEEVAAEVAEKLFPPHSHPEWWWFRNTKDHLPDMPPVPGQEPVFCGIAEIGQERFAFRVMEAKPEWAWEIVKVGGEWLAHIRDVLQARGPVTGTSQDSPTEAVIRAAGEALCGESS